MGGYWLFVFASCLLVQSLSAEGSVSTNSTSAVQANSTSAVQANSTSAVQANSTSAVQANSTSAVQANSTSAVQANSTSAVQANSTSAVNANSTSAVNANTTSAVNANSTSAVDPVEELEKKTKQLIASLQGMEQVEIDSFADMALGYCNAQDPYVLTTLEDPTIRVKKAIGTMVYLRMTLEKTNCTRKDVKPPNHFRIWRHDEKKELPKYCGPLAGQDKEQLDCKFDIFKNERSYDETVVSHDCKPVKVIDDSIFDRIKS